MAGTFSRIAALLVTFGFIAPHAYEYHVLLGAFMLMYPIIVLSAQSAFHFSKAFLSV
ncbi:MAG: hypothetical protein Q6353_007840 [Candidatus Sigynarchaeum springense]